MMKKILYSILLLLFLADVGYSFVQFYHQPLDGDMAGGIVPSNDVRLILESPLGTNVLLKNNTYPNPNRFFSHWLLKEYFNTIPLLVQKFASPIDSIYLSCAIAKIIIQLSLIILLAMAISGSGNFFHLNFMIAIVLITPLFQTNGYQGYMGIIDPATTYTFFYALPFLFLLVYFTPFIRQYYHATTSSAFWMIKILWLPLAVVVCLSGPLNPGIALICCMLIVVHILKSNARQSHQHGLIKRSINAIKMIPKNFWIYLLPIGIFSLYSLYIGRYNSISIYCQKPLSELYSRLPEGIYNQFTQKMGFPVLFVIIAINSWIISRNHPTSEGKKIIKIIKWIVLFAVLYILLLPMGGYRSYRPNVLRYDTIIPVTIGVFFVFGVTTLFLLNHLSTTGKIWYIPLIICVLLIFINSDEPGFEGNKGERISLKALSASKDSIVQFPHDCLFLSWDNILKPEDSETNAQLLTIWRVTKEKKLYYNK